MFTQKKVETVPSISQLSASFILNMENRACDLQHAHRYYSLLKNGGIMRESNKKINQIDLLKKLLKKDKAITYQSIDRYLINDKPHLLISSESKNNRQLLLYRLTDNGHLQYQITDSDALLKVHFDFPYILRGIGKKNDLFKTIHLLEMMLMNKCEHVLPDTFFPLAMIWKACVECKDMDLTSYPGQQLYKWFTKASSIFERSDDRKLCKFIQESIYQICQYTEDAFAGDDDAIIDGIEFCHKVEDKIYKHCEIVISVMKKILKEKEMAILN